MPDLPLLNQLILITGAARRLGRLFALACARAGANIVIHHGHSDADAISLKQEITTLGRQAMIIAADLNDSQQALNLMARAVSFGSLSALVNSAAIFENLDPEGTTLLDWERHLRINLTAPFLLSQAFARQVAQGTTARIINILDWRALRPGADHFPYTITKAAMAALTRSLAVAYAPDITVNGLALGPVLPPSDRQVSPNILKNVPAGRWAGKNEVESTLLFLLTGPAYITGEIIHVDGGRHLV